MAPRPFRRLALMLVGALCAACGGETPTYEITDIREQESRGGRFRTSAERFGDGSGNPHGHGQGGGGADSGRALFAWDTPEGWTEAPPTQFRKVNFRVAEGAECYVSLAGGGLAANINRWRGQMQLEHLTLDELKALPRGEVLGAEAVKIDFSGTFVGMGRGPERPGFRMLGYVVKLPKGTLFLKMTGPEETVAAQLANFEAFAKSLRLPSAHDGGKEAAAASSGLKWSAPADWERQPDRQMRLVTFSPRSSAETQCYITVLGGDGGGVLPNLVRWCQQMGQPPIDAAGLAKLKKIAVLGQEPRLLEVTGDYAGMGGETQQRASLLGILVPLEGRAVSVKMIGPADVVARERDRFIAFCESLASEKS